MLYAFTFDLLNLFIWELFCCCKFVINWFGFNGFGFVVEYFDFNCFVVIDFDLIVVVMNLIGIDFVVVI